MTGPNPINTEQEIRRGFNRDAVRVALTGSVRTAPIGTALVSVVEPYTDEHQQEGYLASDGVSISFDENRQDFIPWQEASAVRTDIIEATTGIQYTMWETGPGKLAEYLGVPQSAIEELAHGGEGFFMGGLPEFDNRQLCVDMFDKGKHQRVTFMETQIAERGDIVLNKEGVYGLQVTRNVYPAGQAYAQTWPEAVGNTAWWEFNKAWKDAANTSAGTDGVAPVAISTSTLTQGIEGTAYSATLAATGGTAPYTWSVTSGDLPAGLELSAAGAITGTPTEDGEFTFTVRVQDSNNLPATRSLTITVSAAGNG